LLRRGKPFSFIDESLNTQWTIHPFAWQLKKGAKHIKIDWEHSEYRFIKPEELKNYDHISQLELGLMRVLVSPGTEKGLALLRNDHYSGAQQTALRALRIILEAIRGPEFSDPSTAEEFWKELRWMAWHLAKNGRPSMSAAVENVIFSVLDEVQKDLIATCFDDMSVQPHELRSWVEATLEARIATGTYSLATIAEHFVSFVEKNLATCGIGNRSSSLNIMTLSSSKTVAQSLASLVEILARKGININLTVLESRPNFEGVLSVRNLVTSLHNHG
jgi:translation initiation factor 2B subunit (eIF-2B alpha/beta/delta family)